MRDSYPDNKEITVCLNCGMECDDKFCPHCGQSTSVPAKLKMKNFGKSVIMSFGRLTPGFFNTAKGLLFHPWSVIRDHLHGRHVRYSPPVTMVIQVFLYATILYAIIDAVFGTALLTEYNFNRGILNLENKENTGPLLIMLDQSIVIQALLYSVPICLIIYLAYFRHGARKFNIAEYLAAYVYMYAALLMYDVILGLVKLIPGASRVSEILLVLVITIFSVIILIKAFPQDKWWKHVLLLSWTFFLFIAFILTIAFSVAFII